MGARSPAIRRSGSTGPDRTTERTVRRSPTRPLMWHDRPMRRLIALAAALSLVAPAVRAAAPNAAPLDAPPPASLENPDVEAWADAYLHTDGWTLLTHDLEGA